MLSFSNMLLNEVFLPYNNKGYNLCLKENSVIPEVTVIWLISDILTCFRVELWLI